MSILQKIIYKIPFTLQKSILKLLYAKQGYKLQDFKSYHNNRFFLYKVDGVYVPSDSIGWFVNYGYYKSWVNNLSGSFYSPKQGDTIVDIGAGIGEEVLVYSEMVGVTGVVYCIEANPEVFDVLLDLIKLNQLKNIHSFNIAISNENNSMKLEKNNKTFLAGSLNLNGFSTTNHLFTIPGKRFNSFVHENGIRKIDLLKVNIEGAERFVIETMVDVLHIIRNVAISCHDFRYRHEGRNEFFKTKELVKNFLTENGFSIQTLNTGEEHKDDWVFGKNNRTI